ncbi:hypothetical protein [Psychroflexus aestuariivivens]|uniref:hypothetical protein n=1 Tax=Psychroflexus aestuariivivens TaxID=1795040 RepID=UPI00195F8557|nr:hypothetical protein [Psychroflexus aestuariivivens]
MKKTTDIEFNDIEKLKKLGFSGFKTVLELIADPNILPNQMGVYLVLNSNIKKPEFLTKGLGGFFKGKDPNISLAELKNNWVDKSKTIYIGKAGGLNGNATLRSRLKQYLRFGQGFNVGHYGGRLIWQLKNHSELKFCWLTLTDIEPRELEKKLLAEFIRQNGKRPFANLTG